MSAWLFDLGNSRLKCAPLGDDGLPGEVLAFAHGEAGLAPGWDVALPPRIDAAYVASVASPARR
ncbi:type III pantothenate kinase, partial [Luteimonas sp. SDU101]